MKRGTKTDGYYHVRVTPQASTGLLLASNSERAFLVSKLQDFLSPRFLINEIPAHKQLASCIDLLAFSIQSRGVELLLFSIDEIVCRQFAEQLVEQLLQYQFENRVYSSTTYFKHKPKVQISLLKDALQALNQSMYIHTLHTDWEYDRYSSIGFYLHDRRGDWMRTWRLTCLYENNAEIYEQFMLGYIGTSSKKSWLPAASFPLAPAT